MQIVEFIGPISPPFSGPGVKNQIIIDSDRFGIVDEGFDGENIFFDQFPGQWNFIWIMEGSTGNIITNTTIKNSSISRIFI